MNFDIAKATDGELLARFEQGRDQYAFAELVRRHGSMVLGVAMRNLNSRQDAEDALQATFFALARGVGRLRDKERVSAWLHATVRRTASSIRRSEERRSEHLHRMKELASEVRTESSTDPVEKTANGEHVNVLDEEIGKLPKKLRAVVVLCCLEGLTQDAAAKQLGVSGATVRDQLRRAKEGLKKRLVKRGVTVGVAAIATYVSSSTKATAAVSTSLVADTTFKALLFAAGRSASEVGTSLRIIHAANQVISSMTIAKLTTCCLVALSILLFSSAVTGVAMSQAKAGTLFIDSFDDGNHADASPVAWHSLERHPGTVEVRNGDLFLGRNEQSDPVFGVAVEASDIVRRDMSFRMEAKHTVSNGLAGVLMRTESPDSTSGYLAGVGYSEEFGGSFAIAGVGIEEGQQREFFENNGQPVFNLPYDVRTEFSNLQIDVFGDEIKVWVWRSGTEMPSEPQFVESDPTYSNPGYVRLVAKTANVNLPSGGEAVFRSVHVADMPIHEIIPEPGTAGMASVGFGVLALFIRRRFES